MRRRGRGRPVRGVVDEDPVRPPLFRVLQDVRKLLGEGGVVGPAEVRAEVVGREVDARLGVLRQALHARQLYVHDTDKVGQVRRDADEPPGVSWRREQSDAVALTSDALGELGEGDDVAEGQPWHHQNVHAPAAGVHS